MRYSVLQCCARFHHPITLSRWVEHHCPSLFQNREAVHLVLTNGRQPYRTRVMVSSMGYHVCWSSDRSVELGRALLSISDLGATGPTIHADERSSPAHNSSNYLLDRISLLLIGRLIVRMDSSTVVLLWSRCVWPHNSCWRTVVTRTQLE
jgi:hypothetical protein